MSSIDLRLPRFLSASSVMAALSAFCLAPGAWAGDGGTPTFAPVPVERELLQPLNSAGISQFGAAVTLDGSTLAVGAPGSSLQGLASGAAFVFVSDGADWSEQSVLLGSAAIPNESFGSALVLDGDTLAVGAPGTFSNNSGTVYVFERTGTQWDLEATIQGAAQSDDLFGTALALDGSRLLVGAPADNSAGFASGAVYVFERNGTAWNQVERLHNADVQSEDGFGESISLSDDRVLIGASFEDGPGGSNRGAAYVFVDNGGTWQQERKLTADDGANFDRFGHRVVLRGERAWVGALAGDGNLTATGAAYVFQRDGTSWAQLDEAFPAEAEIGDRFACALDFDGDVMFAGSYAHDGDAFGSGAAYLFVRSGDVWNEELRILASDGGLNDSFGRALAVDGSTLVVGADGYGFPDTIGAVYLYELRPGAQLYCTAKPNSLGCLPSMGASGVSSATASGGFAVYVTNTLNQKLGLMLYSVSGRAAVPFSGGTLCMESPVLRTPARSSGGDPLPIQSCSGRLRIDMNRFSQGLAGGPPHPDLVLPGTLVQCQWWSRDPQSMPQPTSLSDAIEYEVGP